MPGADYGLNDTDWVLSVPELSDDILELLLPSEITATMNDGTQTVLSISWDISNPQEYEPSLWKRLTSFGEELPQAMLYTATLPEGYELDESAPELAVFVQEESDADADDSSQEIRTMDIDENDATESANDASTIAGIDTIVEVIDNGNRENIDISNAPHFILRHWHAEPVTGTSFQSGSLENKAANRHFVVLEGYMVPRDDNMNNWEENYRAYLVYQDTFYDSVKGQRYAGEKERIFPNGVFVSRSQYIEAVDEEIGSVSLKSNSVINDDGTPAEHFSTFSVSAGHKSVSYGNRSNMNWVYYPGNKDASSGTSDMKKVYDPDTDTYINENPSKGFPRTTVNVSPNSISNIGSLNIYLGDELYSAMVARLIDNAIKDGDYTTACFWGYMERYAECYNVNKDDSEYSDLLKPHFFDKNGTTLTENALKKAGVLDSEGNMSYEGLLKSLFETENVIRIPYSYLPDNSGSTQVGQEEYETDILGYLTYSGYETSESDTYIGEDTDQRTFDIHVIYDSLKICDCENCTDCEDCEECNGYKNCPRKAANEKLITDKDYRWGESYKEAVGNVVTSVEIGEEHTVNIFSGEIALQAKLLKKDIVALSDAGITKIIYTADNDECIDYGLQFGLYTLEEGKTGYVYKGAPNTIVEIGPIAFGEPDVVSSTDKAYASEENVFELHIKRRDEPSAYPAALVEANKAEDGKAKIELGENIDGVSNLDSHFGVFRVTISIPVGNLAISKTVGGYGDKNKEFPFTVELTPPEDNTDMDLAEYVYPCDYDGSKSDSIKFTRDQDGKYTATVELKHGEIFTIYNLPEGVTYTVTESDNEGYAVTATDDSGIIVDGKTQNASFINTPFALTVTKRVLGDPLRSIPEDTKFDFEMMLKDKDGNYITGALDAIILKYSSEQVWIHQIDDLTVKTADNGLLLSGVESENGSPVYATTDDGEYYLYVPSDALKAIWETDADDPAIQSFYINATLIPIGDVDDTEWTYVESDYESIEYTVYKSDTTDGIGNELDGNVQLSYTLATKTVTFDGDTHIAEFSLEDKEGLMFTETEPGTEYTVTEVLDTNSVFNFGRVSDENACHYTSVTEGERPDDDTLTYTVSGITTSDRNSELHYFNLTPDFELPLSGGFIITLVFLVGGIFLLLSGIAFIRLCSKRRYTPNRFR